jgi:hypothetical protein
MFMAGSATYNNLKSKRFAMCCLSKYRHTDFARAKNLWGRDQSPKQTQVWFASGCQHLVMVLVSAVCFGCSDTLSKSPFSIQYREQPISGSALENLDAGLRGSLNKYILALRYLPVSFRCPSAMLPVSLQSPSGMRVKLNAP